VQIIDAMIASSRPEPREDLLENNADLVPSDSHWERRDGAIGLRSEAGAEVLVINAVSASQVISSHEEGQHPERRKRPGRISSSEAICEPEGVVSALESDEATASPPTQPVNPKNLRSLKVRQSLLPITEVVDVSELERFHLKRPNNDLLSRVSKRLEESIKEHT
jgi:hypothetical protein